MSDYNNGALPDPCLRLDYGFGEQWESVELGDGTGYVRLADYEKAVAESAGMKRWMERAEQLLGKREYDIKKLWELIAFLEADLESEFDNAEQMEAKEETYKADNDKLLELVQRMRRYMVGAVEHCGYDAQTIGYTMLGSRLEECEDAMRELGIEVEE